MLEKPKHFYAKSSSRESFGSCLRPGGLSLTHRLLEESSLQAGDRVLDLGCGPGESLFLMQESFCFEVFGLDHSEKLLAQARARLPKAELSLGDAHAIPYANDNFHGILAECSLSLMAHVESVLAEAWRVLKPGGLFILSDLYCKRPELRRKFIEHPLADEFSAPFNLESLKSLLDTAGFIEIQWQDEGRLLTQWIVEMIFKHGSLDAFWQALFIHQASEDAKGNIEEFQTLLKRTELSYFSLQARKPF